MPVEKNEPVSEIIFPVRSVNQSFIPINPMAFDERFLNKKNNNKGHGITLITT